MIRPMIIFILSVTLSGLASAGNTYKPLTAASPSSTITKPSKGLSTSAWFPETLSVVISNRTVSYVSDVLLYKFNRQNYPPTKLSNGFLLTIRDPNFKSVKFQVVSVNTNIVVLQILGTMKRQNTPLNIVENLTPVKDP